jgi:hypothetical protein
MENRKMIIQTTLLMFLLASSVMLFGTLAITKAAPNTIVYVDPPTVTGIMPPNTFTIAVKIENVTNLYGLDVQFTWDPTIIKYQSHVKKIPVETNPGGILHSPTIPVRNQVDENASMPGSEPGTRYWLAESAMLPAPVFNGNGTVFTMTFKVVGLGTSPLRITAATLADRDGNPIPATIQNGHFVNYVPPPPPPPKPANISVNPANVVNSSLTPCHNFTVNINAQVDRLYSYEFWLGFNATMLEVAQVTGAPEFAPPMVTMSAGQVKVASSRVPPAPPINGSTSFVAIKFHVLAQGATTLDLHDVKLFNSTGGDLPIHSVNDGYFNNMLITRMFVDPPSLIDPTMKPSDIFTIDIDIENAIGMYDYEFKLGYDENVLTCLGAIVIPPNNDTNFSVEQSIDSLTGVIWVKVQYYPPALPIDILEARAVTRITFMIRNYGQTILDLYDANISNPAGGFLNPVVEDGFFATLLRDVAITFVNVTSKNKVYPGKIVTIEVVAMNRGNMTTETFDVTVHYGTNTLETRTITLSPWTNTTLIFNWNTSGLIPCNNFTIWAEASPVPYEIDPTNNVYYDGWVKIKMLGDVNGDGTIDILDVVAITLAYGSRPGDPNWNPEADLAPAYGKIDILDLVTCTRNYGWHC